MVSCAKETTMPRRRRQPVTVRCAAYKIWPSDRRRRSGEPTCSQVCRGRRQVSEAEMGPGRQHRSPDFPNCDPGRRGLVPACTGAEGRRFSRRRWLLCRGACLHGTLSGKVGWARDSSGGGWLAFFGQGADRIVRSAWDPAYGIDEGPRVWTIRHSLRLAGVVRPVHGRIPKTNVEMVVRMTVSSGPYRWCGECRVRRTERK